jgi:F420-non-reducing hydrogenase iron-sulfur subunit
MINVVKRILTHLEINTDRVLLEWVSAAEGPRFAEVVTGIVNKVKELGPLENDATNGEEDLKFRLQAAKAAASGEKLRWVAAKQTEFMKDGNKYKEVFTAHETGRFLDGVITEEITVQEIISLLRKEPASVKDIAKRLSISSADVFRHMIALMRKELVKISEVKGSSPVYAVT